MHEHLQFMRKVGYPNCPVHVAVQMVFVAAKNYNKHCYKRGPTTVDVGHRNHVKKRPGIYRCPVCPRVALMEEEKTCSG